MKTWVITGANRGIGLEMTRQVVESGDVVFACARDTARAEGLKTLLAQHPDRLFLVHLDVADEGGIDAAVREIGGKTEQVDVLVNNAGIFPKGPDAEKLGELRSEPLEQAFRTNTLAPLLVAQKFLPLLRKSDRAKVVSITSGLGSIENAPGGMYAYNISKAALNMAMRSFGRDVQGEDILTLLLHPGWVQTDMGGKNAHITPEQSVQGIVKVINELDEDRSGSFRDYRGEPIPW